LRCPSLKNHRKIIVRSFVNPTPGANVIKVVFAVIY
jgi:hypothetical protein